MSKIKQLAEKYAQEAYSNPVDRNVGEADFIVGANAALKEIEPLVATLRSGARKLFEEKFKELKGQ